MNYKNKIIYIFLVIIILILIALNIQVFINNSFEIKSTVANNTSLINDTSLSQNINTNYNTTTIDEDEQNRKDKLTTLNERQRMQTYFGRYLSYIESKDYESAYNLLYVGFKQTYFPNLNEFIIYAQNSYPQNIVVEYTDIEREGTIFILTVKIRDPLNDTVQTEVSTQQIVVMENDINDFKLSFEVKQ